MKEQAPNDKAAMRRYGDFLADINARVKAIAQGEVVTPLLW